MSPIKQVQETASFPVVGKIRLGVRKTNRAGKEYPSSVPHFVLKDAPELIPIYGETPTEIDILFPSDDPEVCIPYYYMWFAGGIKDKDGNVVGGKLQCYGNGEKAWQIAKRDPVTRIAPERECLAEKCPDWKKNGTQQCKQTMKIHVMIPRASLYGVYRIDTTSWNTINAMVNQVTMMKNAFGRLAGIPFRLVREPTNTRYMDDKGKEKSSVQYIVKIYPNQEFYKQHGEKLRGDVQNLLGSGRQLFNPPPEQLIESPVEDNFPVLEDKSQQNIQEQIAEKLADDKDLGDLFAKLTKLRGRRNTKQIRKLTAKKFENEDDPKAALKAYLESEVSKSAAPQQPAAEAPKTEAPPAQPPEQAPPANTPPPNADGLI